MHARVHNSLSRGQQFFYIIIDFFGGFIVSLKMHFWPMLWLIHFESNNGPTANGDSQQQTFADRKEVGQTMAVNIL